MSCTGKIRRLGVTASIAALLLICELGCTRPFGVPADESANPADHQPFQPDGAKSAHPILNPLTLPQYSTVRAQRPIPFRGSETLPPGTLVTVRLSNAVLALKGGTGGSFEATVDAPVLLGQNTFIPRGTTVAGRVESAYISKAQPDRDYVRLSLASIHVGGIDIPVQTASLFARRSLGADDPSAIRLPPGRRLTFRFSEPVYIASQRAKATP